MLDISALHLTLPVLLAWLVYRVRLAQVSDRIRARLEEQMAHRERVARDVHDTLLQSVQGLVLRFQSVADRMPLDAPARLQLEEALKRADEVIIEGRTRTRDFRASDDSGDPVTHLQELADAAGFDPPIPIRLVVEGQTRQVDARVAAEIRRIASEALSNVARHARAHSVDITITYDERRFSVQIRDDGVGIAPSVPAQASKDGHFGLTGMRERAERIGAALSIDSGTGDGTDVMLTLPARAAYEERAGHWHAHLPWRQARERIDVHD